MFLIEALETRSMLSAVAFVDRVGPGNDGSVFQDSLDGRVQHVADIDGDKDIDVIVVGHGERNWGKVFIVANADGRGSFNIHQTLETTASVERVDSGDIDGDGDVDLVFATNLGVAIYENAGDASWSAREGYLGNNSQTVDLSDIDADGDLDIVSYSPNTFGGEINWYENLGGAADYGPPVRIGDTGLGGATAVQVGDINGDGAVDVASLADGVLGEINPTFRWFPNLDGVGGFGEAIQVVRPSRSPGLLDQMELADVDGDADLDIVLAAAQHFMWFENIGLGEFGESQAISLRKSDGSLSVADVDGDGDMDVIAGVERPEQGRFGSTPQVVWFENANGLGDFDDADEHIIDDGLLGNFFGVGDVDRDHDVDVISLFDWFESDAAELSTLSGDIDLNGIVGFSDFLILAANFERDDDEVRKSNGDLDRDGRVGFSDFLILSANFGKMA